MNELINMIVQKTGISQENAQKAAQATLEFVKSKLPPPMAGQLDSFLSGGGVPEQAAGFLKSKLTGAFAGKA